jgi:hypothetical protein
MRRLLQLGTILLLAATAASAQIAPMGPTAPPEPPAKAPKKGKPQRENVEWIWQYTPTDKDKDGRENDLIQDAHFKPFLDRFLTAPQSFWGQPSNGKYRSLADTALDHLTVPGKVIADDQRYVSITGCVVHFCPARGLLWIDLNGNHHLVVFAAIDWTRQGRPTTDPDAEYTLWVFPNDPLTIGSVPGLHPPAALTKAISRWTAQPLAGPNIVQKITHAILVDPDGTPHEVPPASLGVAPPSTSPNTDTEAPVLKPRN